MSKLGQFLFSVVVLGISTVAPSGFEMADEKPEQKV